MNLIITGSRNDHMYVHVSRSYFLKCILIFVEINCQKNKRFGSLGPCIDHQMLVRIVKPLMGLYMYMIVHLYTYYTSLHFY